jgi:hypothetical protein
MNQNSHIKSFSAHLKNSKKNLKNIKFNLLIDFYIKIRLNGSDRLFDLKLK